MLVFGKNVFNETIENPKQVRKVYLGKNVKDEELIKVIKENKIPYETVDSFRLDKMVEGNHQGIVIDILDYEYAPLDSVITNDVIVMLDHLEDVHNFGAIIRTCEAAGIKGIIIPKDRSVLVNGTVMKTSSGAINKVSIARVSNLNTVIDDLKRQGYFIYAADMDGVNYQNVSYANKSVLIIGGEGKGVSRLVKDNSDVVVSIPMKGEINSLNASVAAGILIYSIVNIG